MSTFTNQMYKVEIMICAEVEEYIREYIDLFKNQQIIYLK